MTSSVVSKGPCPACTSSDAYATYEDGHGYCYSCTHYVGAAVSQEARESFGKGSSLLDWDYGPLTGRRISERACRVMGYGTSTFRGKPVHVANLFDSDGSLVAQKLRFADKSFHILGDIKKAGLFGQHAWKGGRGKLVITEGEIDALSMAEVQGVKWPVVSIISGASGAKRDIKRNLEWVETFDSVVLMFDMDEPGQKAAKEVAEILSPGKVSIAKLPMKDASDLLVAGRQRELIQAFWEAREYRPDGIMTKAELWETVSSTEPIPSISFPWPEVQEMTDGSRDGEVNLLSGGTSVGKSSFLKELAYHYGSIGVKCGWIGLEEQPRTTLRTFMGIHKNVRLARYPDLLDAAETREAFDSVVGWFEFYEHWASLDPAALLNKIRYMVRGLDCKAIFLDHISIAVSGNGGDERSDLDSLMTSMTSLAVETGAIIWSAVHLSKAKDSNGSFEEGKQVSLENLRGSKGLAQMGWTILAVERNTQASGSEKNQSFIRVLKCRHTGDTGLGDCLLYDGETGRLTVTTTPVDNEDFDDF